MLSKPKSDLTSSSVSSGGVADLDALDGDLDGVGLGLLALLDLVGPGDGLDVVNVGADQGLVELGGVAVATGNEHAALGGEVVGVLDGLEVDGDVVLGLDGATLDVLEGGTVVEEHLDRLLISDSVTSAGGISISTASKEESAAAGRRENSTV